MKRGIKGYVGVEQECILGYNDMVPGTPRDTSSTDRVPDFESVGSGFESQVPHQTKNLELLKFQRLRGFLIS